MFLENQLFAVRVKLQVYKPGFPSLMALQATRMEVTRPFDFSLYSSLQDAKSFAVFSCTSCLVPFRSQKRPFAGTNKVLDPSKPLKRSLSVESVQSSFKSWRSKDVFDTFGSFCLVSITSKTKMSIPAVLTGLRALKAKRGDRRGVIGCTSESTCTNKK